MALRDQSLLERKAKKGIDCTVHVLAIRSQDIISSTALKIES